jgi:hypothetical protein
MEKEGKLTSSHFDAWTRSQIGGSLTRRRSVLALGTAALAAMDGLGSTDVSHA